MYSHQWSLNEIRQLLIKTSRFLSGLQTSSLCARYTLPYIFGE
jgi:hypothetical protein